jgi:S-adenosylmethionine decarboxylase proenzyme
MHKLKAIGGGEDENSAPQFNSMAAGRNKLLDESVGVVDLPTSTSKKIKEIVVNEGIEISADGNVKLMHDDEDGNNVILRQPKRLPTDHVATLGYKIRETHVNIDTPVLEGSGKLPSNIERDISYSNSNLTNDAVKGEGEGATLLRDQNMPSGQHLLVDIKNVEAAFLNSESRLAEAMQNAVKAAGLTMLSYHCHSLHPAGVSCVGVLLESHISFHTWPDEGVITLDMFTTSEKPLLPVLPKIEELFGIPRVNAETGELEECVTLWSHELRGFRTEDERKRHYLDDDSDLSNWVTSPLEVVYKKQIASVLTDANQQIDIWDAKEREDMPTYADGLKGGWKKGDPRWLMNEMASPARLLFLNGTLMVGFVFV